MTAEKLAEEAARFSATGADGLSARLRELFDYLLSTTLAETHVKEFDIAHEVFGRDASFNAVQDASVRVHIHRLRRKLDEFYAARPADAPRLAIPKGEYRLTVIDPLAAGQRDRPADPAPPALSEAPPPARRRLPWRPAAIAAVIALLAGVGGFLLGRADDVDPAARRASHSLLWRGLANRPGVPLLVLGDYYIFGNGAPTGVQSLTRRFDINNSDELHTLIDTEHAPEGRYVDLNLYYLPIGAAWAIRDVVPLLRALANGSRYAPVVPMSQLQPQMVKVSDLVYVGYLSGLGRLQTAVFAGSRLAIGASYDELIDRRTGRHLIANYDQPEEPKRLHREFAYLSTFPGPDGNRLVIIAGTRDAGMIQASAIARDPAALARIQTAAGNSPNFEALFDVQAAGTVPYQARPLFVAPIDTTKPWRDPDNG